MNILGSGLGLSTVKKLANLYGGDATVASSARRGQHVHGDAARRGGDRADRLPAARWRRADAGAAAGAATAVQRRRGPPAGPSRLRRPEGLAATHDGTRRAAPAARQAAAVGLTATVAAKLFNEFTRIKNEHTVNILCSGLGLSTVKKLANLYGGHAKVASCPAWAAPSPSRCTTQSTGVDAADAAASADSRRTALARCRAAS